MRIKVTTPISIGFFRGIWGNYMIGFKLIAVKLFELSCGNEVRTDGKTNRQPDRRTAPYYNTRNAHIIWSWILCIHEGGFQYDGQMDGQTDGQTDSAIP